FDDPSFDRARQQCNEVADYLRRHGPFEPHRLPMEEMEYTTLPQVAERLEERWQSPNGRGVLKEVVLHG
ncbi:fructose 1,6-bisphosphatase, partial [bacterium]|nr:fructose 1,6-bisphosphatase [bacterium]